MVNDLPEGKSFIHRIVKEEDDRTWFLMMSCQHCANPTCATVCPTNATYIREDGVVICDTRLCVGCKYCIYACPYDARVYFSKTGVADKCWLCMHRVLRDENPGCVDACLFGARLFGRTDDPDSEVNKVLASGKAIKLYPEFGNDPAVVTYIIES
jgi:tetrathionate reductase subunit B